jgi:glucoamylase
LLGGERAHYELALGNYEAACRLCRTLEAQAGPSGFFAEQIWDTEDIPERRLFNGRPSGSAMPLVWAHAEYIKLLRSLRDRRVFDLPPQTVERYQTRRVPAPYFSWRFTQKSRTLPACKVLRLEVLAPARIRYSFDGWGSPHEIETTDTGLGLHKADLPTAELSPGAEVVFTFFWLGAALWEGVDFKVRVS